MALLKILVVSIIHTVSCNLVFNRYAGTLFTNPDAKGTGWLETNAHGNREIFSGPFLKSCNL